MKQIIIQKKYLILVEYGENLYKLFLIIVNFVFDIVEDIKSDFEDFEREFVNFTGKAINYFKALFGFSIYKIQTVNLLETSLYNHILFRDILFKKDLSNKRFLTYSHLLAPPTI